MPELTVHEQACTRCGLCASVCPWRLITFSVDGLPCYGEAGPERCLVCGHCEAVCPPGAIVVNDQRLDPTTYAPADAGIEPERLGAYLRMRRSTRRYREEPVDRAVVGELMDIVRYAPTGNNRQDVHWLVIHDTRELRRLIRLAVDWLRETGARGTPLAARYNVPAMVRAWEEGRDTICLNAPHLVVASADGENPVAATNAVIALAHLEIVAPAFGLGACWGGIFLRAMHNCEPLRTALELLPGDAPVHCMMFGYPALRYQRPPKRNPAAIVWR
jgi:nitroreductase/NAD-dependent dihydropyrimidine dehydrogenase PreA subunit